VNENQPAPSPVEAGGHEPATVYTGPRKNAPPRQAGTELYAGSTGSEDLASLAPVLPTHAGRYQILGEIARGGMGIVLRADDPSIGRHLAVKVLLARAEDRPRLAARFLAEARIAGQLQHPGIPPVHEVGVLNDGRPFFAMKLIQGRTLEEQFLQRGDLAANLPHFLAVFAQVCETLAYAHSRGIIHRDL
jgi:serine/threonine-protein kinase